MNYLIEATAGDYKSCNEDRLTQIFSASFNSSNLFKQIFLNRIGVKKFTASELRIVTQYAISDKDSRFDITIWCNKKIVAVIENKVDAPLSSMQIKKYDGINQIKNSKKIVLVKYFFGDFEVINQWEVIHWSDIFAEYKKMFDKGISNPVDNFIISSFIEYLEFNNMARVSKITAKDLKDFATAVYKIRDDNNPYLALSNKNFFEAGTWITSMFEEIIELARKESIIVESSGKNFRCAPYISWWYPEEKLKHNHLSINIELVLTSPINKFKVLGTGIFFYSKRELYSITTYAQYKRNSEFIKEYSEPKGKDLLFDDYAANVINHWKQWLKLKHRI